LKGKKMSENSQVSLQAVAAAHDGALVTMGFGNSQSFEFTCRTAKMFTQSTMVPKTYQAATLEGYGHDARWVDNPAAVSNCMIALDMAARMNMHPLQVMQNLHIIEGRPSWSSPFIIAVINTCGHYTKLRFDLEWLPETEVTYTTFEWQRPVGGGNKVKTPVNQKIKIKNARCVAWVMERETNTRLESAPVTLEMAVQEGWYTKNGSKWPTMPETMLRYRAASFFGKVYAPELLMGLPSAEEAHDIIDVEPQPDGTYAAPAPTPEAMAAAATEERKPRAPRAKAAKADAADDATDNAKEVAPAAPEAKPGVDADTGEMSAEAQAAAATMDSPQGSLIEEPAQQQTAADTAPAVAAAAQEGPALSAAKVGFVNQQIAAKQITPDLFVSKFGVEPANLRDAQFPAVLAWLKDPK
jgi:hypothetical protein